MTLLGIFGMQWALAAHACVLALDPTGRLMPDAAIQPVSSHCATMAEKASPQQPGLCLEHCTQGKEVTGTLATTDAPAMSVTALAIEPAAFVQIANSWSPPQLQYRNNSPPPLLLSSRLRI